MKRNDTQQEFFGTLIHYCDIIYFISHNDIFFIKQHFEKNFREHYRLDNIKQQ